MCYPLQIKSIIIIIIIIMKLSKTCLTGTNFIVALLDEHTTVLRVLRFLAMLLFPSFFIMPPTEQGVLLWTYLSVHPLHLHVVRNG